MRAALKTLGWTVGAAIAFTALAAATPLMFRELSAFRVARVEVAGARYLSAAEAMKVAGITGTSNVFDDPAAWESALRAHALVLEVNVERRPPSTLRFHIVESQPVAFVQMPVLRPVDARGRVLPIDPTDWDVDLPVIGPQIRPGPDSALDARGRTVVDAFVALATLDQAFANDISEIAPAAGGGVRFRMEQPPTVELLLPDMPDARVLNQVRLALEHLRANQETPAGATGADGAPDRASSPLRLDARYRDEIFVTLPKRRTE